MAFHETFRGPDQSGYLSTRKRMEEQLRESRSERGTCAGEHILEKAELRSALDEIIAERA